MKPEVYKSEMFLLAIEDSKEWAYLIKVSKRREIEGKTKRIREGEVYDEFLERRGNERMNKEDDYFNKKKISDSGIPTRF